MLDQYKTPSTKISQSVPSTVSTVASSQKLVTSSQMSSSQIICSQMTEDFSPLPACMSHLLCVKKKLPVTMMDPPLSVNTRFICDDPNMPNSHKLPHSALCNPTELRAAITPGICYGCKHIFSDCLEKIYCDLCLQSVNSLIDEFGTHARACIAII